MNIRFLSYHIVSKCHVTGKGRLSAFAGRGSSVGRSSGFACVDSRRTGGSPGSKRDGCRCS